MFGTRGANALKPQFETELDFAPAPLEELGFNLDLAPERIAQSIGPGRSMLRGAAGTGKTSELVARIVAGIQSPLTSPISRAA